MVMFAGQKNVAFWSSVQLLINYCQEKFSYKNPLWAYLQGSLHCRKILKIFPCLYLYGDYSSFANAGQKYHKFWGTVGFFPRDISEYTYLCIYSTIPGWNVRHTGLETLV